MKKNKPVPSSLQIPLGSETYREAWEKFERLSRENPGWKKGYLFSVIMKMVPDSIPMPEKKGSI